LVSEASLALENLLDPAGTESLLVHFRCGDR
jgi:hypothetical protein